MNKRSVSIALLSLIVLGAIYSQALRMSIMDFEVVSENPQYKSIGKLTGKTIAAAKTADRPLAKAAPVEKQAVVLQSFSKAVDAIDRKDEKTAKAKLDEAKAIDPANLALIDKDSAFFYAALGSPNYLTDKSNFEAWVPLAKQYGGKDYYLGERDYRVMLGYSAPIGGKAGIGVQVFGSGSGQTVRLSTIHRTIIRRIHPQIAQESSYPWATAPCPGSRSGWA